MNNIIKVRFDQKTKELFRKRRNRGAAKKNHDENNRQVLFRLKAKKAKLALQDDYEKY